MVYAKLRWLWFVSAACIVAACGGGNSTPPRAATPAPTRSPSPPAGNAVRISVDPFTNALSQHATELEPSAAVAGNAIVIAFQMGRFYTSGASDIGFATSADSGATWQTGTLPGTTFFSTPASAYASITDPAVAYDARHATWLISTISVGASNGTSVTVSQSADGVTWNTPVTVDPASGHINDKDWIVCDNHPASPWYGRCYVEWDDNNAGQILMSSSDDGGVTWSAPNGPMSADGGVDGQPLVAPNGTVVVVINDSEITKVESFRSSDGGVTWSTPVVVATIADHQVALMRALPMVSAAEDASGEVYAVWQDCRFRQNCEENDLVLSRSSDGVTWSSPERIPTDDLTSTVDHFIPGLGIDPAITGASARLAITYYSYANASCTAATCELHANFIASGDAGTTWSAPQNIGSAMSPTWLAETTYGYMIGDYPASVFVSGQALAVTALANANNGASFDQAMFVAKMAAPSSGMQARRRVLHERAVPGFHSNHAPYHVIP